MTLTPEERKNLTDRISFILREKRKANGVSQLELSKLSGLSKQHISFLETGDRLPSLETLYRIAVHYNCDLIIAFECECECEK